MAIATIACVFLNNFCISANLLIGVSDHIYSRSA
jgi:hypothetical protein